MSKNKTRTKDKYRVVYNDTQRIELENEFRVSEYISIPRKQEIAQKLKLSERQIKIWFQNRRAKKRKQDKRKPASHTVAPQTQASSASSSDTSSIIATVSAPRETLNAANLARDTVATNARLATSITAPLAPSHSDHQLATEPDYGYEYNYDSNSNVVTNSQQQPNYCPNDTNNHQPPLDAAACQLTNYNNQLNYPPIQNIHHQPQATTATTTTTYYGNQCNATLPAMNHTNTANLVQATKLRDEDFLAESRGSSALTRSAEHGCYDQQAAQFAYDVYERTNSQYMDPQRRLRSSNSQSNNEQVYYTQQMFPPSQQFYNYDAASFEKHALYY